MNTSQIQVSDGNLQKVIDAVEKIIPENEIVFVALKGAFKEYLICTDTTVHIIKKGFMTGHTFGDGDFKMPYENITNAEVDMHMLTGYFELSSGGVQNKRMSYWNLDKNTDPAKQPNVISLNSKALAESFKTAANFIMQKCAEKQSQPKILTTTEVSGAEEIMKFKNLLDQGIITQEEFEAKKRQILGL